MRNDPIQNSTREEQPIIDGGIDEIPADIISQEFLEEVEEMGLNDIHTKIKIK